MQLRRPLAFLLGLLALGTALAACTTSGKDRTLLVDGETVILHHQGGSTMRPLMVVLHGLGGTGRDMEKVTGMSAYADRNGFSVVYPDAHRVAPPTPSPDRPKMLASRAAASRSLNEMRLGAAGSTRAWNAGVCCGGASGDDVRYLRRVVDAAARATPVDRNRVYVVGLSNGGMMATRAVCEAPDVFAAAGTVAGPYLGSSCRRPVWRHLHGGNDPIVPFTGGVPPGARFLRMEPNWCRCSFPSSATETARFGGYVSVTYQRTGTHAWPTPTDPNWRLDGNAVLWQSMRDFRR